MDSSKISQFGGNFSDWQCFSIHDKETLLASLPKNSGVYVIRHAENKFGRLKGNSDILYIFKNDG